MSSKQLKMYLRASLDLIPVSPSWSSGVFGRQKADVPLKSHRTSPLKGTIYIWLIIASCCWCAAGHSVPSEQPRGHAQTLI